MWHSWSLNASIIVQLRVHTQCVCARVLIAYAVIQLISTWSLSSCVIIYAAQWLFCHVECSESPGREAHLTGAKGCPADWFVLCIHTIHAITSHTTLLTHGEMYVYMHTHLAWGSVTVPQGGCWVWFYCLYWLWLGTSREINIWIMGERNPPGLWHLSYSHSAPDHHCVWERKEWQRCM